MNHKNFTLAIGIATAGRREQLAKTLQQLTGQSRAPDRVIVCPASPNDFDAESARGLPWPVETVQADRGLTRQRNAILSAATDADVVLFIDDDYYPADDYLALLAELMSRDASLAVVTSHPVADGATGPGIAPDEALRLIRSMPAEPEDRRVEPTYGGYGCNMAIRMAPVRAHGLRFDEDLPLYGWLEDIDFTRQLATHGRIVAYRALRGVHLGTKQGRTSGLRVGYSQIANPLYMVRKGTMDTGYALRHLGRNVAKNLLRSPAPEPWVDRRGRLAGNLLAFGHLLSGRMHPSRILQFAPAPAMAGPVAMKPPTASATPPPAREAARSPGVIRSVLRTAWYRLGLRDARMALRFRQTLAEWRTLVEEAPAPQKDGPPAGLRVLVLPSDPLLVAASKGDEAMLRCALAYVRARGVAGPVHLAATGDSGRRRAIELGYTVSDCLDGEGLRTVALALRALMPTHVLLIGADVLDGAYDPAFSLRQVAAADLAARQGAQVRISGFSVSKTPYGPLGPAYASVAPSLGFAQRDPISFERFGRLTPARTRLVADIAFGLQPGPLGPGLDDLQRWTQAQRAAGRALVGVNIHPLLLPDDQRHDPRALVDGVAAGLAAVAAQQPVSYLLIAHDYRGSAADAHCLGPLHQALRDRGLADRIWLQADEITAPEIKTLAGHLDLLASGRMHLAIAALGAGTPVLMLDYKDKMEGLLQHFGLPSSLLVPATRLADASVLEAALQATLPSLAALRALVGRELPRIKRLSADNLDGWIDGADRS